MILFIDNLMYSSPRSTIYFSTILNSNGPSPVCYNNPVVSTPVLVGTSVRWMIKQITNTIHLDIIVHISSFYVNINECGKCNH